MERSPVRVPGRYSAQVPKLNRTPAEVHDPWPDVREHWWRIALGVAAVAVGVFLSDSVLVGLFGTVPVLLWCGGMARSRLQGVIVGLVLLALLVWFVAPRGLGWSGRWVPSYEETLWLHTLAAAVVCFIGMPVVGGRLAGVGRLVALVLTGFLLTGVVLFARLEAPPGDESVLPAPSTLRIVDRDPVCGSGGCAREVDAVGDHADERMRTHLTEQGFTSRLPGPVAGVERMCRLTGVVVTHEVCVHLDPVAAGAVRVAWYLN